MSRQDALLPRDRWGENEMGAYGVDEAMEGWVSGKGGWIVIFESGWVDGWASVEINSGMNE